MHDTPTLLPNSRILVVEDDASIRLFLGKVLEQQGSEVRSFASAEAALQAYHDFHPHLVLMDIHLPEMDGVEATRRFAELGLGQLPIVMITAMDQESYIDRAFAAGAWDYITKPVHWPLLRNRLEAMLRRRQAETRTAELDARFHAVFDTSPVGIILTGLDGHILEANAAAAEACHLAPTALRGLDYGLLVHAISRDHIMLQLQRVATGEVGGFTEEALLLAGDGQQFCASIKGSRSVNADGGGEFIVLMVENISQRKQDESRLRLAARVFENASEGIMITDAQGRIVEVNEAFTHLTEYSRAEVIGQNPRVLQSGRQGKEFYKRFWVQLQKRGRWSGEIWNRRKGGQVYPEHLSVNAVTDPSGKVINYVGVFSDISGFKESEQRLRYLAYHDPLTGLGNRMLFMDRVKHAVDTALRQGSQVAILFIDLDYFKVVNDTLGHDMGDSLLEQVAKRLRGCVRESDTVARMGGDEFTVLLEQLEVREDVSRVADCILEALERPFTIGRQTLRIGGSVGASCLPRDARDMESLLRQADAAMYRAKTRGKNRVVFYQDEVEP